MPFQFPLQLLLFDNVWVTDTTNRPPFQVLVLPCVYDHLQGLAIKVEVDSLASSSAAHVIFIVPQRDISPAIHRALPAQGSQFIVNALHLEQFRLPLGGIGSSLTVQVLGSGPGRLPLTAHRTRGNEAVTKVAKSLRISRQLGVTMEGVIGQKVLTEGPLVSLDATVVSGPPHRNEFMLNAQSPQIEGKVSGKAIPGGRAKTRAVIGANGLGHQSPLGKGQATDPEGFLAAQRRPPLWQGIGQDGEGRGHIPDIQEGAAVGRTGEAMIDLEVHLPELVEAGGPARVGQRSPLLIAPLGQVWEVTQEPFNGAPMRNALGVATAQLALDKLRPQCGWARLICTMSLRTASGVCWG